MSISGVAPATIVTCTPSVFARGCFVLGSSLSFNNAANSPYSSICKPLPLGTGLDASLTAGL